MRARGRNEGDGVPGVGIYLDCQLSDARWYFGDKGEAILTVDFLRVGGFLLNFQP